MTHDIITQLHCSNIFYSNESSRRVVNYVKKNKRLRLSSAPYTTTETNLRCVTKMTFVAGTIFARRG